MEGAPKIPTPEAANLNEAPKLTEELREKYEAMTRDQAMEVIIEPSVEKALAVQSQIEDFFETQREKTEQLEADENIVVIHDREDWNKYKDLLDQRRSCLIFIPEDICLDKKLPFHLDDRKEKISYAITPIPNSPDYPTEGNNPQPSEDGSEVDAEYTDRIAS